MTNEEILQLALQKAIKNGYKRSYLEEQVLIGFGKEYGKRNSITLWRNGWVMSHDFAKAFFGEENVKINIVNAWVPDANKAHRIHTQVDATQEAWRAHLQRMVLQEDPIKYLEGFL